MKLQPFKTLVAMSKEKLDEAMAPIRAGQLQKKAELEMLKLEERIANIESKIQEHFTQKKDIDLDWVMNQLDDIALLELRKDQYTDVLAQLFPVDQPASAPTAV